MTLEEAIQHCHEVAAKDCTDCGKEHEQLAEWLAELKQRREDANRHPKTNADRIRNMLTDEYIVKNCFCVFFDECCDCPLCSIANCQDVQTRLEWLKQEVSEDAGTD